MSEGLRQRATRGAAWLMALRGIDQVFRLLRLVILARLVAPDQFGLLGLSLVAVSALNTFTEPGANAALIHAERPERRDLDTAWTVRALRGMVLAILGASLAGVWASAFDAPAAAPVLRWVALSFLLDGLGNIATIHFQRDLDFRRHALHLASGTAVDFGVSLGFALALHDVWALVWGLLAGQTARLIVGYVIRPYRPRPRLDRTALREQWAYGRWVFGSSMLLFLCNQGDDLVVGKLLGLSLLAFYQMAYRISGLPSTEIAGMVNTVLFPTLARARSDPERLRRGYVQALQLTGLLAAPVSAALFVFAGELTALIFDPRWATVAAPLRVLALAGYVRSIVGPGPLFMALGRPDLKMKSQIWGLVGMAIVIVPLVHEWGVVGAAIAATVRVVVGKGVLLVQASRDLPGLGRATLPALGLPVVAAGAASAAAWGVHRLLGGGPLALGAALVALAAAYYGGVLVLDRLTGWQVGELVRRQIAALRGLPGAAAPVGPAGPVGEARP